MGSQCFKFNGFDFRMFESRKTLGVKVFIALLLQGGRGPFVSFLQKVIINATDGTSCLSIYNLSTPYL
jgi:hypothetical protein